MTKFALSVGGAVIRPVEEDLCNSFLRAVMMAVRAVHQGAFEYPVLAQAPRVASTSSQRSGFISNEVFEQDRPPLEPGRLLLDVPIMLHSDSWASEALLTTT